MACMLPRELRWEEVAPPYKGMTQCLARAGVIIMYHVKCLKNDIVRFIRHYIDGLLLLLLLLLLILLLIFIIIIIIIIIIMIMIKPVQSIECSCKMKWYTILIFGILMLGLVISEVVKMRRTKTVQRSLVLKHFQNYVIYIRYKMLCVNICNKSLSMEIAIITYYYRQKVYFWESRESEDEQLVKAVNNIYTYIMSIP